MGPLTPDDPIATQRLPEGVFEAFNDEIRLTLKNGVAVVSFDNVMLRIMKVMDCTEEAVKENDWIALAKDAYEEAGWTVIRSRMREYTFHRVAPPPPPKPPERTSRERYVEFMRRRGGGGSL